VREASLTLSLNRAGPALIIMMLAPMHRHRAVGQQWGFKDSANLGNCMDPLMLQQQYADAALVSV